LGHAPEGLDTRALSRRISALLPMMSDRSVPQALAKMEAKGAVKQVHGRWRLHSSER
jgi:hypothetical protein